MKISLKSHAIEKKNGAACTVIEHALQDEQLDMAIATIAGRYPDAKRVVNSTCSELAYVFEGEGQIVINDKSYQVSAGDAVLIDAGEKYYWEGQMKLFLSCRPAWKKEQHHIVE